MCSRDGAGSREFDASVSLICEESEDFYDDDEGEPDSYCQGGKQRRLSTLIYQAHG